MPARRAPSPRLYDISQELSPASAVFPGDTRFTSRKVMEMRRGGSCDVGTITMSVHTGTHADAAGHYLPGGASIDRVPLDAYLGPARVVELNLPRGEKPIDAERVRGLGLENAERVLLKTRSAPDPTVFNLDFAYLTEDGAKELARLGLRLLGIDTPSVDRHDSRTLSAHKALAKRRVSLLENLVLAHVPPGDYELVALPLRLRGLDASPVRAVLRSLTPRGDRAVRARGRGR